MKTKDLFDRALKLLVPCNEQEALASSISRVRIEGGEALRVVDADAYVDVMNCIYGSDIKIPQRFSRHSVYKFLDEHIFEKKFAGEEFTVDEVSALMEMFTSALPSPIRVIAPISGIRLDGLNKFQIGPFEIGESTILSAPISNEVGYYIAIEMAESYDNSHSIDLAQNEFNNFIRIIYFIAGRQDKSIFIKTGLPSYPSYNHHHMYVETSSYHIETAGRGFSGSSISNKIVEKVPVNSEFFLNSEKFSGLWGIYDLKRKGKASPFQVRILNCALAIGEAIRSQDVRNSIIYTCISLEILLSYDEGSIFQKSIGDRLSDTFVFIVAMDKESRVKISALLKKVYRMRSALVHGGDKEVDHDYMAIIALSRSVIGELLTNDKYRDIRKIDSLYEMVKLAQYSYS